MSSTSHPQSAAQRPKPTVAKGNLKGKGKGKPNEKLEKDPNLQDETNPWEAGPYSVPPFPQQWTEEEAALTDYSYDTSQAIRANSEGYIVLWPTEETMQTPYQSKPLVRAYVEDAIILWMQEKNKKIMKEHRKLYKAVLISGEHEGGTRRDEPAHVTVRVWRRDNKRYTQGNDRRVEANLPDSEDEGTGETVVIPGPPEITVSREKFEELLQKAKENQIPGQSSSSTVGNKSQSFHVIVHEIQPLKKTATHVSRTLAKKLESRRKRGT